MRSHVWVVVCVLTAVLGGLGCGDDEASFDERDAAVDAQTPAPVDNRSTVVSSDPLPTLPTSFALDDVMSIEVPKGASYTTSSNVTSIRGQLMLRAANYSFPLANASLSMRGSQRAITQFSGTAMITLPALHTFSGLGLQSPLSASLGYDTGASLSRLGLPLEPGRKYLYFTFGAGFQGSFGTGSFSAGKTLTTTVIVDPKDPAFFLAGPMDPLSAIAFSEHGYIPYNAETTWGFDNGAQDFPTFQGHSFMEGEVSLEEFPVTVSGSVTSRFGGWNGITSLDKTLFDHTVGVNGSFNLGWDFADGLFHLEVPLAKASLYLSTSSRPVRAEMAVSGTVGTDTFMPSWIPVVLSANHNMAGYIDSLDAARNHVDGESALVLMTSTFSNAIGMNLHDLTLSQASYHVDHLGFRFRGEVSQGISPEIASASAIITACFGGDTVACLDDDQTGAPVKGSKDWLVRQEGDVTIAGIPLASATALANSKGVTMTAYLKTKGAKVEMSGSVHGQGVGKAPKILLTGSAAISLELNEVNEVLQAITDGAVCGYREVTNAAKCGSSVLDFSDSLHCGKPHCSWSWKHGLRCKPLRCQVDVPKSCNDLTQPKTCKKQPLPFNLGSISGSVAVTIDNGGIKGGKLTGKFCASGSCATLHEVGSVDFPSPSAPRFCITSEEISPALPKGHYCVDF